MKSVMRSLAVLTAVLAMGTAASAATEADMIEISGNVNGAFDSDLKQLTMVGVCNYYLIQEVSIGLEAMVTWDKTDAAEELAFAPHLRIDYYFNTSGETVPYVGAMMGAAVTKDDSVLEQGAHIGVKQFVDTNASLNIEVGCLFGRDESEWLLLIGFSLYDRP